MVQVSVTAGQTDYAVDLSTLTDGAIASSLQVNPDSAGNSFTPVALSDSAACSPASKREVGTFPHFHERCESLQAEAFAEIVVSSRPMSVERKAQVKAASREGCDRLAMGPKRGGDRGRLRADFGEGHYARVFRLEACDRHHRFDKVTTPAQL